MKTFNQLVISFIVLILPMALSHAAEPPKKLEKTTIKCTVKSSYINGRASATFKFVQDQDGYMGGYESEDKASWQFSWSMTECEDSTDLVIAKKDLADLLSGKENEVYAEMTQEEPDFSLKATVACSIVK